MVVLKLAAMSERYNLYHTGYAEDGSSVSEA